MGINFRRTINHKILGDKMSAIDEYGELKKQDGIEQGLKEGMEKGMEKIIKNL